MRLASIFIYLFIFIWLSPFDERAVATRADEMPEGVSYEEWQLSRIKEEVKSFMKQLINEVRETPNANANAKLNVISLLNREMTTTSSSPRPTRRPSSSSSTRSVPGPTVKTR